MKESGESEREQERPRGQWVRETRREMLRSLLSRRYIFTYL